MELFVKHFSELTAQELYEIYRLRVSVFVVEQKCCYQEVDDADENAYHVWLRDKDGIEAYARVLPRGATFPEVSIGRVIAVKRRCGLGKQIVAAAIGTAKEKLHADKITIEAQTYVKKTVRELRLLPDVRRILGGRHPARTDAARPDEIRKSPFQMEGRFFVAFYLREKGATARSFASRCAMGAIVRCGFGVRRLRRLMNLGATCGNSARESTSSSLLAMVLVLLAVLGKLGLQKVGGAAGDDVLGLDARLGADLFVDRFRAACRIRRAAWPWTPWGPSCSAHR